jgi:aminoglycoside/choline kinase family phosphotransferase
VTDLSRPILEEQIRESLGAGVELAALSALAGDASSRRYYRAQLQGQTPHQSVIVMQLPEDSGLPMSSEELAVFKEAPRELPFVNVHRFLSNLGVHVPAIYAYRQSDRIVLLEDLGDTALWDRVQGSTDDEVLAWYRKAIDELLLLHTRGVRQRDDQCIAFQQRFDRKLYLWEFEHFIEWGLEKRPGAAVAPETAPALRRAFAAIAGILDAQPACLSHRDYHSWNLMVHRENVRVIDFQDALLAPPQYDLASLLNDRITDRVIRPDLEQRLVEYYIDRSSALSGAPVDRQQFFEIYRLSAIQRDLKVIGRFYYLDLVKGKPGYRRFIAPTARRLLRNFDQTAQTRELLPLLREHFEAMQ